MVHVTVMMMVVVMATSIFMIRSGGGHDQAGLVVTVITDGSCRLVTTMSTDNDVGIKRHLLR